MTKEDKKIVKEDKKIVIVIGAGASCDFYPAKFSFPVGEVLIKKIGDTKEIAKIFLKEIINDSDFSAFSDSNDALLSNEIKYSDIEAKYPKKEGLKTILKIKNDNNLESILFLDLIVENFINDSPYLQISRLVNYYQPFSIDELLDSIKTEKIDVFEPLKIKKEDLKAILKSDENDFEKLEKQFRNELIDAGKTLIALFLLRSEKRELFDNPNSENDSKIWYRHIRNLIINSGKNAEKIKEQIQNLTIISFNYDRSLDYYLRTRLSDYYNEIKKKIFYPYGKLAVDNWDLNDYGSFERDGFNPYNQDELEKIRTLGKGLRVIGELDEEVIIQEEFDKKTRSKLKKFNKLKKEVIQFSKLISRKFYFKQVEKVLKEDYIDELGKINKYLNENSKKEMLEYHQKDCEFLLKRVMAILSLSLKDSKIYFLGFAFHQANCNFLALNQLSKFSVEKKIYYTNFDESESINNAVKEIFYIPSDRFITIHESKKKGVYNALMHDFKLEF